jgi:hypothetical protein
MRWRTYNDIIDKLCAWFLYQQLYQELAASGMLSTPEIRSVMQYMKQLCVSSAACSTRATCKDIWKRRPFISGISSCLEYLERVIKPAIFEKLEKIVSTHMIEPCLDDPKLSQFRIIDANNTSWQILRKDLVHSGNQLMFFINDNLHVSIPSSWDIQKKKEIHISFDENKKHYRDYRSITWENKFSYTLEKTVVIPDHGHNEHAIKFTLDQSFKCDNIFTRFRYLNDDLSLWRCDDTNNRLSTIRSPCRARTRSPPPSKNPWDLNKSRSRSRSRSPRRKI